MAFNNIRSRFEGVRPGEAFLGLGVIATLGSFAVACQTKVLDIVVGLPHALDGVPEAAVGVGCLGVAALSLAMMSQIPDMAEGVQASIAN